MNSSPVWWIIKRHPSWYYLTESVIYFNGSLKNTFWFELSLNSCTHIYKQHVGWIHAVQDEKNAFFLLNCSRLQTHIQQEHRIYFFNCIKQNTNHAPFQRTELFSFYLCPCYPTVSLHTHKLTNTRMCKHAHTRVPLIRPQVTLTLEFWVSDKAMLVLSCFSPTQTLAKQGNELTPKTCWMVGHHNNMLRQQTLNCNI